MTEKDRQTAVHMEARENVTVAGLAVKEYEYLQDCEKELRNLEKRIAACVSVNTDAIDKKEAAYRAEQRKNTDKEWRDRQQITEEEREKERELEKAWLDELDKPQITIDAKAAEKLFLEFVGYGMTEKERNKYGFSEGTPKGAKVQMKRGK